MLPLCCSLVLDSQAVFEDVFRLPWDFMDVYAFPPFLSLDGWWLESERPWSLHDSGCPPLTGECVVRRPSSLNCSFPGSLTLWQGFVCLDSLGLSLSPLLSFCPEGLGLGDLSWNFLCSLEFSRGPSNLRSCIPLRGMSLSSFRAWRELHTDRFRSSVERFSCPVTTLPVGPCLS